MKELILKYDREKFWKEYWERCCVDPSRFKDLSIYPIAPTLKNVKPNDSVLECGFGGGRVLQHLANEGCYDVFGLEYDESIVRRIKAMNPKLNVEYGDIAGMHYVDHSFDVVLCFGVIAGLQDKMARAVSELIRITKPGGTIVVSVMLNNTARRLHKFINSITSTENPNFYAWMDTVRGWNGYFRSFGLKTICCDPVVSRYSIYYWTPFLRSKKGTDFNAARVDEKEYQLNMLGEIVWRCHKHIFQWSFAMAATFSLKVPE